MSAQNPLQTTAAPSVLARFGERFSVDPIKLMATLKATAFRQRENQPEVTNDQMMALLIVADQYGLNPFTREIYAYPDKQNGIVPVVGVDGWSRIINQHPAMDGIAFVYSDETIEHKGKTCHAWIDCSIHRKDRDRPIVIREFFDEVVRKVSYPTPWDTHPNRMHRHKALIQCARVAFGFVGVHDEDEAERIIEGVTIRDSDAASVSLISQRVREARAPLEHEGTQEQQRIEPAPTQAEKPDVAPEAAPTSTAPTQGEQAYADRLIMIQDCEDAGQLTHVAGLEVGGFSQNQIALLDVAIAKKRKAFAPMATKK